MCVTNKLERMEQFMSDIQKSMKRENIRFLLRFLDEAINCGEIAVNGKKRLMENGDLKGFFQEERDELVETLEDTAKELSTLKEKIRSDGLDYLLDGEENTFDGRTTFPEEDEPETDKFIIRYIRWAIEDFETIEEINNPPQGPPKVVYKVFKKGTGERYIRIKQGFTLNGDEAMCDGTSCGVITGPDSTYPIYDLKGIPLYELDNILDEYYR